MPLYESNANAPVYATNLLANSVNTSHGAEITCITEWKWGVKERLGLCLLAAFKHVFQIGQSEAVWRGMYLKTSGGRLNKKDGLTRYGNSHVKDKTVFILRRGPGVFYTNRVNFTCPVECVVKLLIFSQTSSIALLKFASGWFISSHTL